jgi:hypothetical protein
MEFHSPTICWQRWMKNIWIQSKFIVSLTIERLSIDVWFKLGATNQFLNYPVVVRPNQQSPTLVSPTVWKCFSVSIDVTPTAIGATLNWIVGVSSALNSGKFQLANITENVFLTCSNSQILNKILTNSMSFLFWVLQILEILTIFSPTLPLPLFLHFEFFGILSFRDYESSG